MTKPSTSPDRHTFQKESYIQRLLNDGGEPNTDYIEMFDKIIKDSKNKWADPETHKDNMEYDLVTTDWILEKTRASEAYAQNLYAAMCNNDFIKNDMWPILREQKWGCSWRYAGGIIADMRQHGDYIDWYCSGILNTWSDEDIAAASKEDQERYLYMKNNFVNESVVTDEIRADLLKLGWIAVDSKDD